MFFEANANVLSERRTKYNMGQHTTYNVQYNMGVLNIEIVAILSYAWGSVDLKQPAIRKHLYVSMLFHASCLHVFPSSAWDIISLFRTLIGNFENTFWNVVVQLVRALPCKDESRDHLPDYLKSWNYGEMSYFTLFLYSIILTLAVSS